MIFKKPQNYSSPPPSMDLYTCDSRAALLFYPKISLRQMNTLYNCFKWLQRRIKWSWTYGFISIRAPLKVLQVAILHRYLGRNIVMDFMALSIIVDALNAFTVFRLHLHRVNLLFALDGSLMFYNQYDCRKAVSKHFQ